MKRIFSALLLLLILALIIPYHSFASEWRLESPWSKSGTDISQAVTGDTVTLDATYISIHTFTQVNWNVDQVTWTMTGTGPLVHVAGNTTAVTATNTEAIVAGTTYKVTITGTGGGGTATYTLGGVTGTIIPASGAIAITNYITASTAASMVITPTSACTVSITNVAIEKMIDATGDLTVDGNLTVRSPIKDPTGTNVITLLNGNVGIGTTGPVSKLQVTETSVGAITTPVLLTNVGQSTEGSGAALGFSPFDGSVAYTLAKIINYRKGAGDYPLTFQVWNGSALAERMRIDVNGNVGIGTTAPSSKLNVVSSPRTGNPVAPNGNANDLVVEGTDTGIGISILNEGTSNSYTGWIGFGHPTDAMRGYLRYTHSDNLMQFATAGSIRATIDGSGNVGIGTTAPIAKLDVNGSINIPNTAKLYVAHAGGATVDTNWSIGYQATPTGAQIVTSAAIVNRFYDSTATYGFMLQGSSNTSYFEVDRTKAYFSGNVGIGTTVPQQKLDVINTIQITDFYTDASNYEGYKLDAGVTTADTLTISAITAGTGADNLSIALTPAGTGSIKVPTGTVTNPIIVSDDADSGFYFGSKGFNWSVDGVNKLSLNSAGVLSIGSNLACVHIVPSTATDSFGILGNYTDVTSAKTRLYLLADKSGNTFAWTNTSGQNYGVSILPAYNQTSGTAANTDLLINRTETAVGSGVQYLIDAQVGGVSKFSISNNGVRTGGSVQVLTGAGAVDIINPVTHLVTTGANALTIANGVEGQYKVIIMKTDAGNGTLTGTFAGFTTLTFDDVGDSVQLIFTNSAWHWIGGRATAL